MNKSLRASPPHSFGIADLGRSPGKIPDVFLRRVAAAAADGGRTTHRVRRSRVRHRVLHPAEPVERLRDLVERRQVQLARERVVGVGTCRMTEAAW